MPQGTLFGDSELCRLRMTMMINDLTHTMVAELVAETRKGIVLASSGVVAHGLDECELLPIMVTEATYGFLYRDHRDAVVLPAQGFRARRKSLQG